jgi:RNA polymerase sigma factor (sigma-70 family)
VIDLSELGAVPIRTPLRWLTGHAPLSRTQQRALFRRLRRPETSQRERDELRSRLVAGTLQVVVTCLRGISGRRRVAELAQEGVLALARAVDAFPNHNQHDFARFAGAWVARCLRRVRRMWARERELLVSDSLDRLSDPELADPFSAASQTELEERLDDMMRQLPTDQQRVIRLRFGIGTREAQSREAIGKQLQLGLQRVRYLEERALSTLRRRATRSRNHGRRADPDNVEP